MSKNGTRQVRSFSVSAALLTYWRHLHTPSGTLEPRRPGLVPNPQPLEAAMITSWWTPDGSTFAMQAGFDNFLDAGHRMVDHSAALISLSIREDLKAKPYKGFGWDRQKILTATPEVWQKFYVEWPSIPWETDVTEHARRAEEISAEEACGVLSKGPSKATQLSFL